MIYKVFRGQQASINVLRHEEKLGQKNVVAGGGPATLGGVLLRVFSLEIIISGNNEANMN